jgi:hypothetical protein
MRAAAGSTVISSATSNKQPSSSVSLKERANVIVSLSTPAARLGSWKVLAYCDKDAQPAFEPTARKRRLRVLVASLIGDRSPER